MTRGARTQADLERAVRSTQRRSRDHEQRLRIIERRLDAEDRQRGLDDVAAQILRLPHSPARTNSSPAFPTGGSDLAGTARCRARPFFARVSTWAVYFFGPRRTSSETSRRHETT